MAPLTPFFIVGCARSGTTMLQRLLNRHSQVCVPEETHFIPRKIKPFIRELNRGNPHNAVEILNSVDLIKEWNVRIEVQDIKQVDGELAYAKAVHLLMSRRASLDNKFYWGEKTPWYLLEIPLLRILFPEARFIHIYRDGRDVALSVMPTSWGPNNVYSCAHWWKRHIQVWIRIKPELGSRSLEICYEKFTQDPETHLRRICQFLNLPYEDKMLEGYKLYGNNFGKWRNVFNMKKKELAAFEYVAGETLSLLGYEKGIKNPRYSVWLRVFSKIDNIYKIFSNWVLRRDI